MGAFSFPNTTSKSNIAGASGNMFSLPNALGMPSSQFNIPGVSSSPYGGGGSPYSTNFQLPSVGMGLNPGANIPGTFGNEIKDYMGTGVSNMVMSWLQGGAGYNPQVAQALFQQMQPQIARNLATIDTGSGVAGTRFGSAHDFAMSDYLSQVTGQEQAINAQLYQHSTDQIQNLFSSLIPSLAQSHQSEPGIMDYLGGALGAAGSLIGAPFTGGLSLAGLGGSLGKLFGGGATPISGGSIPGGYDMNAPSLAGLIGPPDLSSIPYL